MLKNTIQVNGELCHVHSLELNDGKIEKGFNPNFNIFVLELDKLLIKLI